MGKTRPPYPPEFRAEAIRLVRSGGLSQSQVARDLDAVAIRLNARPRKTLGYETPADRLAAIVASTP